MRQPTPLLECNSRKHHLAFCPEKFGYFSRSSGTARDRNTVVTEKNPSNNDVNERKTSVNLVRTYCSAHTTARATVVNPITKQQIQIRALFDGGCPDSFILSSRANELGLSPTATSNVQVSVFGTPESRDVRTRTVEFFIETKKGLVQIWADTMDYIQDEVNIFDTQDFRNTRSMQIDSLWIQLKANP